MCTCCDRQMLHVEADSCYVCSLCGKNRHCLTVRATKFGENVTVCVYSRSKRFEMMLKAVLYPSFDKKDTTMYKHLADYDKINSIIELEAAMKTCNTKEKRFHSLHLFSKLLCGEYIAIAPPTINYYKQVMNLFDEILCQFNAKSTTNFFSYPWLLKKLLNVTGVTRYDAFIKKIRCKKRNMYYQNMLHDLVDTCPTSYLIRECGIIR